MSGSGRRVPLQDSAHANGSSVGLAHDTQQSVAVARVAGNGAVRDVPARVLDRADAAVADVAQERRLIHEAQHEIGVVVHEFVQCEPLGLDRDHWCSAQNGSTVRSTKSSLR